MTMINFILDEHQSELTRRERQIPRTTTISTNIHQNTTDGCDLDDDFLLFEGLIDDSSSIEDSSVSSYEQSDENITTNVSSTISSDSCTSFINKRHDVKKNSSLNRTMPDQITLFVAGLKSNVSKINIRNHFKGCIKVVIKKCRTTPFLKYAFVVHSTLREAERNLRKPIDFQVFGPECRVEYANKYSSISNRHQNYDKKKLVVSRIPENVSEDDLHNLFIDCHILKYCPARAVYRISTTTKMIEKSKVMGGYAFITYDSEQQASNVIEHADQYKINDQSLTISLYRNKNSPH